MERAWTISCKPGSNDIAIGFDQGMMYLKVGRETPAVSMDNTGKVIFAKQNEIFTMNVRTALEAETIPADGEKLVIYILVRD